MVVAPLNGAQVGGTEGSGKTPLSVSGVGTMALWSHCLSRPPPTAGRGAAGTVPRPVPIAVPGLPSVLLHGAGVCLSPGVCLRAPAGPRPHRKRTETLEPPPIPRPRLGCCILRQAHTVLSLATLDTSSVFAA